MRYEIAENYKNTSKWKQRHVKDHDKERQY